MKIIKITDEEILFEILNEFKKLGYVIGTKDNQTIVLFNPTKARTIYITEDNNFAVGIGFPFFVGFLRPIVTDSPTFKEKRLIKKLIKLRKEKTNENQIN